jgi:hypothetical protein
MRREDEGEMQAEYKLCVDFEVAERLSANVRRALLHLEASRRLPSGSVESEDEVADGDSVRSILGDGLLKVFGVDDFHRFE